MLGAAGFLAGKNKEKNISNFNLSLFEPTDEEREANYAVEWVEHSLPEVSAYYDNWKGGLNTETGYMTNLAIDRKKSSYYVIHLYEHETNPPSYHKEKPISIYYWVDVNAGIIKDESGNIIFRENSENQNKIIKYKTYRNEEYGFEFKYPAIYDEKEEFQSCGLKENINTIEPYLFVSVAGRVWVQILDSEGLNLSEYIDKKTKQDLKIESRKNGMIDGNESIEISYRISGSNAWGEMAFILKNKNFYAFSLERPNFECDSEIDNISIYSVYGTVISTFKFTEKSVDYKTQTLTDLMNQNLKVIWKKLLRLTH